MTLLRPSSRPHDGATDDPRVEADAAFDRPQGRGGGVQPSETLALPMSRRNRLRRHLLETRGGLRPLLTLAIPLVVSTGCFSLTLFVDRTLLLWFDPSHAGAAMAAGNLYWTLASLPVMAIGYLSTIVAQAHGAKRDRAIGPAIWQAVWLTAASLPFCLAGVWIADRLFLGMGHATPLAEVEAAFFRCLMLVAPGAMLEAGLSAFYVGRGQTRTIMRANVAATVVNLLLDAVLIFGLLGLPAMGAVGAALATAAAMWIKVVWYGLGIARMSRQHAHQDATSAGDDRFGLRSRRPNVTLLRSLLGGGGTLGLQQMLRSAAISGVLAAVGQIGASALAASSLVMSLVQLATIPLIGLATAVTVLSGQRFAESGTPRASWTIATGGVLLSGALLLPLSIVAIAWPDAVVAAFAVGPAAAEVEALAPQVQPLLLLAAALLLLDTVAQVVAAALRGLGAVRALFVTTAIASGVVLTLVPACGGKLVPLWSLLLLWTAIQAVGCLVCLLVQPVGTATVPLFGVDAVNRDDSVEPMPGDSMQTADDHSVAIAADAVPDRIAG